MGAIHIAGSKRQPGLPQELPDIRRRLPLLIAQRAADPIQTPFGSRDRVCRLAAQIGGIAGRELADGANSGAFGCGLRAAVHRLRRGAGNLLSILVRGLSVLDARFARLLKLRVICKRLARYGRSRGGELDSRSRRLRNGAKRRRIGLL